MKKKTKQTTGEQALALHKKWQGKLSTATPVTNMKEQLSLIYTPGVGAVSARLARFPHETNAYTSRGHTVAVISDGSAVLGLGNIGPEGALPVMEGKAVLFKKLGGVDAVPIVLGTQDPDEIVQTIKTLAPTFGGINLEDIAAPKCFAVEERLKKALSIPVMHDDQHGTAIVVLAGLINAHKVVKKDMLHTRVAVIGAGAAGVAITKILIRYGIGDIVVVDSTGIVHALRPNLSPTKEMLARITNNEKRTGGALEAMTGADVVIGVSGPNAIHAEHVRMMAQKPIVFAMANPVPEIMPDEAYGAGAAIVATGRSDFPNQVNNALAFPGIFKGALQNGVTRITDDMKVRVAEALASLTARPTKQKILPTLFDKRVVKTVASVIQ